MPAGLRAGSVRFELPETLRADVAGQVCLDQGEAASSAFLGSLEQYGLTQGGKPTPGGISLTYYRPGEESLLAMGPEFACRIGITRGHLGGAWRAVAIALLFAAGVALSAWLLGRSRAAARRAGWRSPWRAWRSSTRWRGAC